MGVAEVEEGVILVDVSAPTADDVAAQLIQHLQCLGETLGVAGVEGVQGHPVTTHGEHGLVIDEEAELTLLPREGGAIQLHGADARLQLAGIRDDVAATQGDGDVVQVGQTCVLGVPQVGAVNGDEDIPAGMPQVLGDREGAVPADALHRDGVAVGKRGGMGVMIEGVVGVPAQIHGVVEIQLGVAAGVVGGIGTDSAGVEEGLPNGGCLDGVHVHGTPDTPRHGAAEDIPAEGGGGLSRVEGGVAEGEGARRGGKRGTLRFDHGGVDMDHQLVAGGLQRNITVQGNLIGQKHIFSAVHPLTVYVRIENRVDAVKL